MPNIGMEENDRKTIINNISWLVDNTNIDALIQKLLQKGVFSQHMIEKYQRGAGQEGRLRKVNFYQDVTRRGPTAFTKLIESFLETGHFDAAQRLHPDVDIPGYLAEMRSNERHDALPNGNSSTSGTVPICLPQYMVDDDPDLLNRIRDAALSNPNNAHINLGMEPLRVQVKMATERLDLLPQKGNLKAYPMGSRPKGYLLMINNVDFINAVEQQRRGAEIDEKNLKDLFEGLGYIVVEYRDQGIADMRRKIEEFAAKEEHKKVDSCVIAIMSHGHAGGDPGSTDIVASDGHRLSTSWIIERFNNYFCQNLMGKPKIFIFQTCRGGTQDYGFIPGRRHAFDGYPPNRVRLYSDMLFAYSTIPGYVSIRDKCRGTWFIEALCQVFMEHAKDTEIRDMLDMVDVKLSHLLSEWSTLQTSSSENWGFQKFYFCPGLYADEEQVDST